MAEVKPIGGEKQHIKGDDPNGVANQVAAHYNQIQQRGLGARRESRVFHMRSFNNWIKATLIGIFQ